MILPSISSTLATTAALLPLNLSGVQFSVLGQRLRIVSPGFLFLAPLALLLGVWGLLAARRRWQRARALVGQARAAAAFPGGGAGQGVLRSGALGLAAALLLFAAAGPQCGDRTEVVKRSGVDLVVVLDASTSMLARDVRPSRIERAKAEVSALLSTLKGDRVGLVVFAGDAFPQCPLTIDYSAARLFLRAVDPNGMPRQGTAIGPALLEAQRMLQEGARGGAAKVVLLLSDGEDIEGDALSAAGELAEAGVKVYAVAIGGEAGEPIPLTDAEGNIVGYKKDRQGKTVLTRTDIVKMREIASRGGGRLLRGSGYDLGVASLGPELDKMQKADLESRLTVHYDDRYAWFGWPALALLCLAAALGEGRLTRPALRRGARQ